MERPISSRAQQGIELPGIFRHQFIKPAFVGGVLINLLRLVGQRIIDSHNRAVHWSKNIRCRFHGLNNPGLSAHQNFRTDVWQLHVDHISQRLLGMVSNADRDRSITFLSRPLVGVGIK